MSLSTIQAVSFDAAGTLIHLSEPVGATYSKVAARHGIRVSGDALERAFRLCWGTIPAPFAAASPSKDPDERAWWRRFVSAVFREAGAGFPSETAFDRFFDDLYLHYESPGAWLADRHAAETLRQVSASFRCVLLSNFDARLRRILGDLDLLHPFERHYLSCELRASKPDRRIFEHVAADLELPPSDILHVGDDPICDWQGAGDVGFRVFRAGRRGRPLCELIGELSLA